MLIANFPVTIWGTDSGGTPATATALAKELSSAAVDAELARISRSWRLGKIEKCVGAFKPSNSVAGARKKSFHALRAGSRLQEGHAIRIQVAFPRSNIYLWWAHPLAAVLCDATLGIDDLIWSLRRLPAGNTRDYIWSSRHFPPGEFRVDSLTPWSDGLVSALRREARPISLFALLVRLRIEQLSGRTDLGLIASNAAWDLLPESLLRSRNLLISKDTLIVAMDYFMSWQPFADARLLQMMIQDLDSSRFDAIRACNKIWANDNSIPNEIKVARSARLMKELLPKFALPGGMS